jgi:hypothetical protein
LAGSAAGLALLSSAIAGSFDANFNDNQLPPGTQVYGDTGDGSAGIIEDGVLKLTKAVGSQQGGFVIEDLDAGAVVSGFTTTFKLLIGGGNGADGFSFNFAPDVPDWSMSEEGAGNGLSVCFDVYDNGGGEAPAIDLKNGMVTVASTKGVGALIRQNRFVDVMIQVNRDGTLNLSVDNTVVYTNFYGAFVASPGRFGLGARTGGANDNHWVDDLHIVTSTEPPIQPAHPLIITNAPSGSGVAAEPVIHIEVKDLTTQVNASTIQLLLNGALVTPTVTKTADITTIEYDPPGLLPSQSTNKYTLVFADTGTTPFYSTNEFAFSVVKYRNVVLPAPIYLETFDAAIEGELPTGWVQTNATTSINAWLDLDDPDSDSYLGWTVIDRSRLDGSPFNNRRLNVAVGYLNGVLITNLVYGQCVYAESDNRSGNQIQMLFSPDFDLTGKTDVHLAFNSFYEQNQDSIGIVEYSIDQGKTWLPVIYMLNDQNVTQGGSDILRMTNALGQVVIDAAGTLTNIIRFGAIAPEGTVNDTPLVDDGMGGTRRTLWPEFIEARPIDSLGPYIDGRMNDDPVESKRIEVFRLPQADNQPKVRLRFAQAGTGSWYFGIDNLGLYSIRPEAAPMLSIAKSGNSVTVSWPAGVTGFTLQSASSLTNPQWASVPGVANNSVTITIGTSNQFFRLVKP